MKKLTKATLSVFLFVLMFAVSGIQAQAASKAEIESTGTRMTLNQEAKGVLTSKGDEDWFIFDVTQPGYFNLTFNTTYADADAISKGWDIYIYDSNDLINCVGSYGSIKNKFTTANFPMHTGRYYVNLNQKGVVKLDFSKGSNVNIEAVNKGWDVYMYDAKTNTVVASLSQITNSGSQTVNLNKGAYYVKVVAYWQTYAPMDCQYDFKVSFTQSPNKTKITSIKSSKKKVTLKWKKEYCYKKCRRSSCKRDDTWGCIRV